MSEKRRDNRNQILREGEYQRKDGRGIGSVILMRTEKRKMYTVGVWIKMTQCQGEEKREPSLREKEKQIEADLFHRIVTKRR